MIDGSLNLEVIMKSYIGYIYAIIQEKSNNLKYEDIEEIISDVYLSLWNNQERLDINKELSPYIAGITKNLIKKKYRNIKNHDNIDDYEEKLIINEKIKIFSETNEKNEILINKLQKMKEEDRKIFMLFYYEDKKIKEISGILNISESKIKSKLSRLRKKMKTELERRKTYE